MAKVDLVIHTAGPFQRIDRCHVLEAAIDTRTPYLDVCDDTTASQMAKKLHPLAKEKGVPAIIGGGIYPGLSNVMAAHIISLNKKEYDDENEFKEKDMNTAPIRDIAVDISKTPLDQLNHPHLQGIHVEVSILPAQDSARVFYQQFRIGAEPVELTSTKFGRTVWSTFLVDIPVCHSQTNFLVVDALSVDRVRYSYFTAGSGGTGKTLMVTSFMLLGEPVVAFRNDRPVMVPAMSQPTTIDFGPGVGRKGAYLLNLPEVVSAHGVFGAKNASARFGTSPAIWNWILWAMARWIDDSILRDRDRMSSIASLTLPITRLVDRVVGETVAMRIDVEFDDATSASGIYVHDRLSISLGICVAAFANRLLNNDTKPGVWFPEEKGALKNRRAFLKEASKGCQRLILNRPAWQIESDPKRIGLGMYYY